MPQIQNPYGRLAFSIAWVLASAVLYPCRTRPSKTAEEVAAPRVPVMGGLRAGTGGVESRYRGG
jgi:hypothetical protein